jgi:hypothetical protein
MFCMVKTSPFLLFLPSSSSHPVHYTQPPPLPPVQGDEKSRYGYRVISCNGHHRPRFFFMMFFIGIVTFLTCTFYILLYLIKAQSTYTHDTTPRSSDTGARAPTAPHCSGLR